jgi:hypothetical protein
MRWPRALVQSFVLFLSVPCQNCARNQAWPLAHAGAPRAGPGHIANDDALVRSLPVCIASENWSAGELGASILYRYERAGKTLSVGYFVYWTAERPWGWNALSYAVLPALVIDAFYSHLFFVFPGAQHFMYGPGDVEGARIAYEQKDDGTWVAVSAVADDATHREVRLLPADFVDGAGVVVLTTDVWSHQLGAHRVEREGHRPPSRSACYVGASLAPLTPDIAEAFRLGSPRDPRRAPPAWNLSAHDRAPKSPS